MASSDAPGRSSSTLRNLVELVEEAASDPKYAERRQMWTRHNRLEKQAKVPVSVHLHSGHTLVWQELIPPETLLSKEPLERDIELQLRQKLYRHEHIPDDEVLLPTVWVNAVRRNPGPSESAVSRQWTEHSDGVEATRLWGLPALRRRTNDPGGAYKVVPAMTSEAEMANLRQPGYDADTTATQTLVERATELVGGSLPVKVKTDELSASPSETMVGLLGIEAVLFGVVERPEFIHRMMDYITDGFIAYHLDRERAGVVDAEGTWGFRVHYEELAHNADPRRLANTWWYISAQSLAGISPGMFDEFLQPYHARLSEAVGDNRVYYHGCENLTKKFAIIRKLPNLRRFHISPWTDLERAVEELGRQFVLETHVSYADTLYVHTRDQMREALTRIMQIAGDCIIDINLGDIETVRGNPSVLTDWARAAQEVTERHA